MVADQLDREAEFDRDAAAEKLSPRQRQIVDLLGEGLPLKDVVATLRMSRRTGDTHLYGPFGICQKLRLQGVWGVAVWAVERRIRNDLRRESCGSGQPLS